MEASLPPPRALRPRAKGAGSEQSRLLSLQLRCENERLRSDPNIAKGFVVV